MGERSIMDMWTTKGNGEEYTKAGFVMRLGAFVIDHVLICLTILVPGILLTVLMISKGTVMAILMFPVIIFLFFAAYLLKDCVKGVSIGKYMMGLAVRTEEDPSKTPTFFKLVLRNILTFFWPLECFSAMLSADQRKIGDRLAKTDVYRVHRQIRVKTIIISSFAAFILFGSITLFGALAVMKGDSSYQEALNYIETSEEINSAIGTVKGYSMIPIGSMSSDGSTGQADYTIKVIGERGTAVVNIQLEKQSQDWTVTAFDYDIRP